MPCCIKLIIVSRQRTDHCLTTRGLPTLNKYHRDKYAIVLDFLQGLAKQEKWRDYVPKGAIPLPFDAVKKIFNANIMDPHDLGRVDLERLRNKVLAIAAELVFE